MRFITYKKQCRVFKALIEMLKVISASDHDDANFTIGEAYQIAYIVGGKQMAKLIQGGTKLRLYNTTLTKWNKEEMAKYIRLLEEIIEEEFAR